MQADFSSVEAELREIEADFACGRMNAFGSAQAQDAFLRELKRIAEIETQVFYKSCSILKSGNNEDHTMLTDVFASAQPPPPARDAASAAAHHTGTSHASNGSRAATPSTASRSRSHEAHSAHPSQSARAAAAATPTSTTTQHTRAGSPAASQSGRSSPAPSNMPSAQSRSNRRGGLQAPPPKPSPTGFDTTGGVPGAISPGAAPHIKESEWMNETGFPDRAFENVAARFQLLEQDFNALGEQLRGISEHVMQLNEMSEEVNRTLGAAVASSTGVHEGGANANSNNNSGSSGGGGGGGSGAAGHGGSGASHATTRGMKGHATTIGTASVLRPELSSTLAAALANGSIANLTSSVSGSFPGQGPLGATDPSFRDSRLRDSGVGSVDAAALGLDRSVFWR